MRSIPTHTTTKKINMKKAIVKLILVVVVWILVASNQWWEAIAFLLLGITFLSLPESKPKQRKLRIVHTPITPKIDQEKATKLLGELGMGLELAVYLTEDDYEKLSSLKSSKKLLAKKSEQLTEAQSTIILLEDQLTSTRKILSKIGELTWERKREKEHPKHH